MIKALVLDVDGVLVGEKIGYNSPNPNPLVIDRLTAINKSGLPIVLCTGKPHYSISAIIEEAGLKNPHITNGGSVIIDPIAKKIVASYEIDKETVKMLLDALLSRGIYTEIYTEENYYIVRSQENDLTRVHSHVLQRKPIIVDSFDTIIKEQKIIKIMPITDNESGISAIEDLLLPFSEKTSHAWGLHPIANPHQFCGITAKGISKRQTTLDVLSHLHIDPVDTLGVGDSTSDWKYMELCGYVAAMENAQTALLELVRSRGEFGYIGGHVDENGILPIFDHFTLPVSDTHP